MLTSNVIILEDVDKASLIEDNHTCAFGPVTIHFDSNALNTSLPHSTRSDIEFLETSSGITVCRVYTCTCTCICIVLYPTSIHVRGD